MKSKWFCTFCDKPFIPTINTTFSRLAKTEASSESQCQLDKTREPANDPALLIYDPWWYLQALSSTFVHICIPLSLLMTLNT